MLSVPRREAFNVELLTVGRVNLDLYAQELGRDFPEVAGFDAMVGGSPVNVAIAASRLGVSTAVFTAVGVDLVGDWVLRALQREHVNTEFVPRKPNAHTSLALRAEQAPDHPLAFYRHDPADIHLTVAEAAEIPLAGTRAVLVSADALARGSTAMASVLLLRWAAEMGKTVYLDLDLREVNWSDHDAYSSVVGAALHDADVLMGTEAEFAALLRIRPEFDPDALAGAVRDLALSQTGRAVILKRGERGALVFAGPQVIDVPPFAVSEASTVGAGDSFAAGIICCRRNGLDWATSGRFACACAAITVSQFGCSAGFPRLDEVIDFVEHESVPGVADQ